MQTKQTLKIAKIQMRNFASIENLEFHAGKFNLATGKNGLGKTSWLTVASGHNAKLGELIMQGKKTAETVLVYESGETIHREISREDGVTTTALGPNGEKLPKDFLSTFNSEMLATSPARALALSDRDFRDWALSCVKLELDAHELQACAGLAALPEVTDPMAAVQKAYDDAYQARRDHGRDRDTRLATAQTMAIGLSPLDIAAAAAAVDRAAAAARQAVDAQRQAIAEIGEQEATRLAQLDAKAAELTAQKEKTRSTAVAELRAQIAALELQIAQAETEHERELAGIAAHQANHTTHIRQAADAARAQVDDAMGAAARLAESAAATARAEQLEAVRSAERRAAAAQAQFEADEFNTWWAEKDAACRELELLKKRLLSQLPVEGMEFDADGKLTVDGIPFATLNRVKRTVAVCRIAAERARMFGAMCIDDMESLDSESMQAFVEWAWLTDLQFFVTKVTDQAELTLQAIDATSTDSIPAPATKTIDYAANGCNNASNDYNNALDPTHYALDAPIYAPNDPLAPEAVPTAPRRPRGRLQPRGHALVAA